MAKPVKWYRHGMYGLPVVWTPATSSSNISGKLADHLDAILVDGFGLLSVDSIVVSGEVATVTRSAGFGPILDKQVLEIAGVTSPTALNDQWRVITMLNSNTVTLQVPGIGDGSASGTMTIKTPSLGWERVWSSGYKRVYRSQHADSPKSYFRINDDNSLGTAFYGAALAAYTDMTDIDTGLNLWGGGNNSYQVAIGRPYDDGAGRWFMVGDDRTFYMNWQDWGYQGRSWSVRGIGEFISFKANDVDNEFFHTCSEPRNAGSIGYPASIFNSSPNSVVETQGRGRMRRDCLGNYGCNWRACRTANDSSGISSGSPEPFPSGGKLLVTDAMMREHVASQNVWELRGKLRGVYHILNNQPLAVSIEPQFVMDVEGLAGRLCAVMYLSENVNTTAGLAGRWLVDLDGPWEVP